MRWLLAALALVGGPLVATAAEDPSETTASATRACLAAVIDGAPVDDMAIDGVRVSRSKDPNACTVQVEVGEPAALRRAALAAVNSRRELFGPAKTQWEPGAFASRETFCNLPGRRALNVIVSTSMPGAARKLSLTVLEARERDVRCDRDQGLQKPSAN
ncbi:hypothetical protein [Phenylobacterium sp.]|uniref:hypothetical protein n=1 Tax=Phenylobacterium sp. TaxID=1871053 RepID=UPI003784455B